MTDQNESEVRGLRAAAKVTGRSVSGLQKMVDGGDLPARKIDDVYVFAVADLEAIRLPAAAAPVDTPKSPDLVDDAAAEDRPEPACSPCDGTKPALVDAPKSPDNEVAAWVFADLAEGKGLCEIVVNRKLPPDEVRRWHQAWRELDVIDHLRRPEGERRLRSLEMIVEARGHGGDMMLGQLHRLEARLKRIESVLGSES